MSKTRFTRRDRIFRELLKEVRIAKGMTQTHLAARLGLPQSYVSKYETGERRLDFVETVRICEAVEITIEEFARAYSEKVPKGRPRAKSG